MAKNTHAQEVATGSADSYTENEMNDPNPPLVITRAVLGEVDKPSVGTDSSASSESEQTSNESGKASPRKRAPTTENRSEQTDTADSDVHSTVGSTRKTGQQPSGKSPAKGKAGVRSVDDEDDFTGF